jgi:hypothetical protein
MVILKRILTVYGVLALGAVPSFANIFGIGNVTIDPEYTSPVIAPFSAPCPPYPSCPSGNPTTWPQGFPIQNIFGAGIQTAEGTPDTIFANAGYDPSVGFYDNVFFHLTNLGSLTGTFDMTVTGAQDGPTNTNRAFGYFDLYTYSGNVNAPDYQLLFSGTPTTTNGFETLSGAVSLNNTGPYFIYQFGAPAGPGGAPRIFGVTLTATPEPGFYGLLALGLTGLATIVSRRRKT